jgi:hypothetical protein
MVRELFFAVLAVAAIQLSYSLVLPHLLTRGATPTHSLAPAALSLTGVRYFAWVCLHVVAGFLLLWIYFALSQEHGDGVVYLSLMLVVYVYSLIRRPSQAELERERSSQVSFGSFIGTISGFFVAWVWWTSR